MMTLSMTLSNLQFLLQHRQRLRPHRVDICGHGQWVGFFNWPPPRHQDIPRQQVDFGQQEPARSMGKNDGPKIKDSGFKPKPDDVYVR